MFFTFIGGTYRRQTSTDSLPLYEADPIYGNTASVTGGATFAAGGETVHHPVASRMNSLPRIMPTHRRKILGRGNLLKYIPSYNHFIKDEKIPHWSATVMNPLGKM